MSCQEQALERFEAPGVKPQYQEQGALPIELTLSQRVNIKICTNAIVETTQIPYCTIENLKHALDTRVNVIALVKSFNNASSTVTTQGKTVLKREIVIADMNKEATATLLADNAKNHPRRKPSC